MKPRFQITIDTPVTDTVAQRVVHHVNDCVQAADVMIGTGVRPQPYIPGMPDGASYLDELAKLLHERTGKRITIRDSLVSGDVRSYIYLRHGENDYISYSGFRADDIDGKKEAAQCAIDTSLLYCMPGYAWFYDADNNRVRVNHDGSIEREVTAGVWV